MEWVKLRTAFYNDPAIVRAGEAAEVLFVRAMAYCGEQETDGVIPTGVLTRLVGTKASARAAALVREGLWEVIEGGWRFTGWSKNQTSSDELSKSREGNRARQQRYRDRHTRNGVTNGVTHASVTGTEVEEEVDAAAAARDDADLPGPIQVLASKLRAHTALAGLRFDSLDPEKLRRLVVLVEIHGDARLVDVAIRTLRTPPPVYVGAFLGTWEALPAPGQTVRAVQRLCDVHGTAVSSSGVCSGCAADEKVGAR